MRFTFAEAMTDPSFYIPLAKAAEAAGYHAMTIPDSVAYPFESDAKYPYTPDGNREFLDGTARYTRVPQNAIRYILRKRELKPNYARQLGPVEVWDVRDVPFRYHRDGELVLHGKTFSRGEHDQCHDTSFWSVRPAKEDLELKKGISLVKKKPL